MALQIEYLAEHLDAIPVLARWHHEEWASITPHLSLADRIAGFRARAQRGTIPTGLVAVLGGEIVGLACLVQSDIESHVHLTPWLASVLVAPEHRGREIASPLCERAINEARALGIPRVYQYCSTPALQGLHPYQLQPRLVESVRPGSVAPAR